MPGPAPSSSNLPIVAIFRAPLFNASETFVQAQAASLSRYRPVLVGLQDKGHADDALKDRLVVARSRGERLAFQLFGSVGPLAARLRPLSPVLVHAHFGTDGLAALPLARRLGVPLATTLHGHDVGRSLPRLLLSGRLSWTLYALRRRRLMRDGALFLAVSEAVRDRAIACGFPADRIVVHHVGVDLDTFRPAPDEVEPGLVLHVGRLVEKKGTSDLLSALARVRARQPHVRLAIIGDGPLRAPLERQAERLGLGDGISFLGALPPADIAGWMRRAWLIAAPSVTARGGDAEGLPTVLVEASASGLPAIATEHMGIPEIVLDQRTGFLVPERDPAALADRLEALLAAPRLRAAFGLAARAHAEAHFDLQAQTRSLESLYDGLAARG